ncbi:hypothetical protein Bca4012_048424 [Brassica carinata]
MKPQVVTIHKIFSDANMPPNFDEIDEKEGSNDDSDGEDHRRFNLESPRLLLTSSPTLPFPEASSDELPHLYTQPTGGLRALYSSISVSIVSGSRRNAKRGSELMGVDMLFLDESEQDERFRLCLTPWLAFITNLKAAEVNQILSLELSEKQSRQIKLLQRKNYLEQGGWYWNGHEKHSQGTMMVPTLGEAPREDSEVIL